MEMRVASTTLVLSIVNSLYNEFCVETRVCIFA
jgi:hypothetical protein